MSKGSEESYRQTVKKASLLRAASVKKQNKKNIKQTTITITTTIKV